MLGCWCWLVLRRLPRERKEWLERRSGPHPPAKRPSYAIVAEGETVVARFAVVAAFVAVRALDMFVSTVFAAALLLRWQDELAVRMIFATIETGILCILCEERAFQAKLEARLATPRGWMSQCQVLQLEGFVILFIVIRLLWHGRFPEASLRMLLMS